MRTLSRRWKVFLVLALAAGLVLRLIYTNDMEWKEDEYYDFVQTRLIGISRGWPWEGMNSGVYLANPGMSVWIFVWLARIARATDPVALQRALGILSVAGIALLVPFALLLVGRGENPALDDREPWLWTCALAMVNPFLVFYQRKLWPEPFFALFSTLMLAGWWRRDRAWGALLWGLIGAILGQIHMSGFFLAAALAGWTAMFGSLAIPRRQVRWGAWLAGSAMGALPLVPWAIHVLATRPAGPVLSGGWGDVVQLKFWVFWVTDPLGLHLGNPLGLLRGGSLWAQISDFVRYPLIAGHATYLCGLAHAVALLAGAWAIGSGCLWHLTRAMSKTAKLGFLHFRKSSQEAFAQSAALWGFGALLTATRVNIRRYYLLVAFPLQQLWLVRLALARPQGLRRGRIALAALWVAQLAISATFVGYVHVHGGSTQGDYGEAYHLIQERHKRLYGEPWPDLKLLTPDQTR